MGQTLDKELQTEIKLDDVTGQKVDKRRKSKQVAPVTKILASAAVEVDNAPKESASEDDSDDKIVVSSSNESMKVVDSSKKVDVAVQKSVDVKIQDCIDRLKASNDADFKSKSFCLKNNEIFQICQQAREVLMSQPTLLSITAPIKIVGDTHGQFSDLLRIFNQCGQVPQSRYLFLGDYCDRGKQSLETVLLLLCYKIQYPNDIFLLRGNHECSNVNRVYGFYDECKRRTTIKVWKTFTDVFNCLPLAAVVADKIFCVHGGLSPHLKDLKNILDVQRPIEIPEIGLLNDLLWSDPNDNVDEYEDNDRGVSYTFGKKVVAEFLAKNDLDLVARAHMVVEDGYEFFGDKQLVTIFSAPNYCGEFNNAGGVMVINTDLVCSFEIIMPLNKIFQDE